jgi:RNA-directed DNA polymerase
MSGKRQKRRQIALTFGEKSRRVESIEAAAGTESPAGTDRLMEEVCEAKNVRKALKKVQANKGAPGVDGMTVEQLSGFLRKHWPTIRDRLLDGSYEPKPVLKVEIPKPSGGTRQLGIPCVLDRFVQQAVMQVLQERWDSTFSERSYGFRPGRSAHQAVAQAQQYVAEGYEHVVDIDLEKFFDRVNHDMLMARVAKRVTDKRLLRLLRAFLKSGIMDGGLVSPPEEEGVPQGGPLSPLLSNLFLDDLDRELERRGHRFVRYADDCNVYVRSERAGHRVMETIKRYLGKKLKLKVNEKKSKVARANQVKFLGFKIIRSRKGPKRGIAKESLERFKRRVRELTGRSRGRSLDHLIEELSKYLAGWRGYYGHCETPKVLRDLDSWIRRRLRSYAWEQWATFPRRKTKLIGLGIRPGTASHMAWRGCSERGPWHMSRTKAMHQALDNRFFREHGLVSLVAT